MRPLSKVTLQNEVNERLHSNNRIVTGLKNVNVKFQLGRGHTGNAINSAKL